jgi:serine/threonine protein kinase
MPSSPPPNRPQKVAPPVATPHSETLTPSQPRIDTNALTTELPAVTAPLSLIGKTFGDFELVGEIGRGGMGVVFKARQISLERIVALKMLLAQHLLDPARLLRFLAEARIIAGLDHPNIVHIYQVGQCEFGHFFAMEYIHGQTLEAVAKEKQPFPLAKAVSLMTIVGEAIQFAHTKGVVHRDLNPANIMIDRFRRPVVMDFGIAKDMGKASSLTQQGAILGTPAFMAPEQTGDDRGPVGPHTDIYALGAILYLLLTGKPPYEGPTALRTILNVIGPTPPAPPRELRADVPAELERIVLKCLAKQPADRFASAAELVEALRRRRCPAVTKNVPAVLPQLLQVILTVQNSGKEVRLRKPITLIGRARGCTLVLRASDVSKQHCQILIDRDTIAVEDLGSANGTFVNGKRIKQAHLHNGDELRIADHALKVRIVEGDG